MCRADGWQARVVAHMDTRECVYRTLDYHASEARVDAALAPRHEHR